MKRCLSMILVFLMCLSLVPQGASAQTVSTEELLFLLAEYLTDGASSGLEVEIEPHGGEGGKVIYSPNGENGAELALVTPEGCIGLDAQGVYIDRDGKTAGVAMDELTSFLLESTLGISHLPRFSAHDGAMLVGLLDTLWSNVMQDAVRFETDGLSQASLEIDVDRLAVSVDDTLNRLLEEYAAEVDVLLNEYGGLLGNFVYGFPQNVG